MTKNVASCHADMNLAAAGALMWEQDCGILPVVDEAGKVISVITDRDICIALCTRNERPSDVTIGEVATSPILSCTGEEDVRLALDTMRQARVRRLPVVSDGGILEGIVSMDDIAVRADHADGKAKTALVYEDVVTALQAIRAQHQHDPMIVAAE